MARKNGSAATRVTRRRILAGAVGAGTLAMGFPGPALLAQSQAPIKLGMLNSFSKVFAVLSAHQMNGWNLFLEQNGGRLGGRSIEMIREDDEINPQVGLQKLKKLVESDRIDILLGVQASNVAMAVVDYVRDNKVFWICSGAGATALTWNRIPYMFRTTLSGWQLGFAMSRWYHDNVSKDVVLMSSDFAGGRDIVNEFKHEFVKLGGTVVKEIYPPLGTNDFSAYLTDLRALNAKGIYTFFAGTDAVRFVKQYEEYGLKRRTRFCTSGFAVEQDTLSAQGDAAVGIVSPLQYADSLDLPENRKFVADYQSKYKARPSVYAEYGYTSAIVLDAALKATGGDAKDKDKLAAAMKAVRLTAPRGPLSIDPVTHNVIDNIYIREVIKTADGYSNKVIGVLENVRDPGVKPA